MKLTLRFIAAIMILSRVASFSSSAIGSLRLQRSMVARYASLSNKELAVPAVGNDQKGQWRPTVDDVVRISWGKPAKQKGTGSRGVPHRLNSDERVIFDLAVSKGFLEVAGSGWRKERREAPLVNTYRSFCDASLRPLIVIFKTADGNDEVCLDLSPLRRPEDVGASLSAARGVCIGPALAQYNLLPLSEDYGIAGVGECESMEAPKTTDETGSEFDMVLTTAGPDDWFSRPIYQLPWIGLRWPAVPRSAAKKLAKELATAFNAGTPPGKGGKKGGKAARQGGSKQKGMPNIKPGKSRRHGGYGIG